MLELSELARELGVDARTLRRAAADGTIRCERISARRQRVEEDERRYAAGHWPLLAALRRALRTEPNVRLAVLYGSVARGDDTADSDLDLLVSLGEDRPDAAVKLAVRLERMMGREVDVARLNRVQDTASLLLLRAIDEGRVVLDRDDEWSGLKTHRSEIARRARRSHEAEPDRFRARLERLSAQRTALRRAMGQFGKDFDANAWMNAYDSPDPDDINRVFTVTGGYLALVNNTAGAIKAGIKLTGLKSTPGMPGLPGMVDAVRVDGGFTKRQAETFVELYRTRNRLQHSSPDIEADEVHRQVRLLLRHLPGLVKSYLAWLERHDVEL
jgi:predicted nucleotidyltransferase